MRSVQFVRERTAEPILKEGFQDSPYPDRTEDGPDVGFLGSPDVWGPENKGRKNSAGIRNSRRRFKRA